MGAGRGKGSGRGGSGGHKSLALAYALWLVLGVFGAHLFYVRRDRHCFLALVTLNFFGFGWIRDGWRLREYVAAANNDQQWSARLAQRMRDTDADPATGKAGAHPTVSRASHLAQYLCASYFGTALSASAFYVEWLLYAVGIGWHLVLVTRMDFDAERPVRVLEPALQPWSALLMTYLRHALYACGAALGVVLAGTCDPTIRCDKPLSVVAYALAAKFACVLFAPQWDSVFVVASAAMHAFRNSTAWNRARTGDDNGAAVAASGVGTGAVSKRCGSRCCCRCGWCWRSWRIGLAAAAVVVLLCVHVYTTVEFDAENGEKVKLSEAFHNFKRSKAYAELWHFAGQAFEAGFWESIHAFMAESDLDGTDAAYDALGIPRDTPLTARALKKVRNELAVAHHPDKAAPHQRAAAEVRFREIQDAYATLLRFAVKQGNEHDTDADSPRGRTAQSDASDRASRRTARDEDDRSATAAATARATAAAKARAEAQAAERAKSSRAQPSAKPKAQAKTDAARAAGKDNAKRTRP